MSAMFFLILFYLPSTSIFCVCAQMELNEFLYKKKTFLAK